VEPRPDFSFAISNTPTGLGDPLYDFRGGPRSSAYFRDAETGLDYAVNRYHQPGMGRFLTPDPSRSSARSRIPGSWNRYAYVLGDPIKYTDRKGLEEDCTDDCDDGCEADFCADGWGDGGGGGGGGGGTCDPCDPTDDCFDPSDADCSVWGTDKGGTPVSDKDPTRDLLWMRQGWPSLKSFSTSANSPCGKDLSVFGITSSTVDNVAGNTQLVNYSSLAPGLQGNFDPGADFTAVMNANTGATFVVYNQSNFWEATYSQMLGTLLHEIIHLSSQANYALSDTQIQKMLGLTQNASNTSNISMKLAADCFPNATPQ
jgi:RHS repeat-associated protein